MTKELVLGILLLIGGIVVVSVGVADPHTTSKGQPNQNCEEIFPGGDVAPPVFTTAGFAHATTVYAGAGQSLEHANSPHAVSQYDVACFQQAQRMLRTG
ncbi:hypothetical protein [Methanosphaerula palustris]|uniref:Adenylate cyclase n=1 Tax=Methanosphaerula palustris (strain ATCC BAA-1556 / DSM 19958 / E1-9c) TaxID=521011 RepID=B8GFJ5_METPE|nr:hypothetical protein [Methanosphaerula palustris]ACL16043.1 hypothetical protein Mpal_0676 [Methanosphaerula palustris E1-9c]